MGKKKISISKIKEDRMRQVSFPSKIIILCRLLIVKERKAFWKKPWNSVCSAMSKYSYIFMTSKTTNLFTTNLMHMTACIKSWWKSKWFKMQATPWIVYKGSSQVKARRPVSCILILRLEQLETCFSNILSLHKEGQTAF